MPAGSPADPRFELAWAVLDEADRISARAFGARAYDDRAYRVWAKADGSPVTTVDLEVEQAITGPIRSAFARDLIRTEESGMQESGGDQREPGQHDPGEDLWVIDPLDGTANFAERVPVYAHMITRISGGSVLFAIISAPLLGRRWWAYRDHGAFEGGQRLSVSGTARISGAAICYGGLRDYDAAEAGGLVALIRQCARSRAFGSFFPHMLVAEGTYDLASCGQGGELWDLAPVDFIVTQAGGRCTALSGASWRCGDAVLTSNGVLHDDALAVMAAARGDPAA
jgi:histidinol-phosphatase